MPFCSGDNYDKFPCGMENSAIAGMGLVTSAIALFFAIMLMHMIHDLPAGNAKMQGISTLIHDGAKSFLVTEYKYLAGFVVLVGGGLLVLFSVHEGRTDDTDGVRIAFSFVFGAILSATAGWFGMMVATDANVRTTHAAEEGGLNAALQVAFKGGAVMGFTVVGLGLAGISVFYLFMGVGRKDVTDSDAEINRLALESLAGFGFGASSIALFARVAGGIYTKAADVGADLVGKVEAGIPEDDPRNPAVIADNVGDNVGDVAGMGADLFESFVGSIISAATLAKGDTSLIALPFWIASVGILASVIGFFFVSTENNATQKQLMWALHKGTITASVLVIALSAGIIHLLFNNSDGTPNREEEGWEIYACILIGLFSGILIGEFTEYFTSYAYKPTQSITAAGSTGPATVVIQGLGIGMISCVPTITILAIAIIACNALTGNYGIAIAAVGMLSTLGITLATDAYGPIADNAGGIAEMAELDESVRDTTDALDALGNTTAATGKGFAIGSAVLTALSLMAAFQDEANVTLVNIGDPIILASLLIGAMLPLLFAALTMLSVQKAAGAIIVEVRRQFREIAGLMEGMAEPDCKTCIEISTRSSIQEMILPGAYAVLSPLVIGLLIGPRALAGMLGGAISSGAMVAILMSNAGGAWDNSKKYIEIEGAFGGKGTETHKACVVGDTVGDPFKDTSGPALNILIKLMSMIALTIAPILRGKGDWDSWGWGLIPLALIGFITIYIYEVYWNKGGIKFDTTQSVKQDQEGPIAFEEVEMVLSEQKSQRKARSPKKKKSTKKSKSRGQLVVQDGGVQL